MKGHSTTNEGDEQGRLCCAAVSSAAYMAANTVTEIIGASANIRLAEEVGEMYVKVTSNREEAMPVFAGLKLHMEQLSGQFPDHITIISEV